MKATPVSLLIVGFLAGYWFGKENNGPKSEKGNSPTELHKDAPNTAMRAQAPSQSLRDVVMRTILPQLPDLVLAVNEASRSGNEIISREKYAQMEAYLQSIAETHSLEWTETIQSIHSNRVRFELGRIIRDASPIVLVITAPSAKKENMVRPASELAPLFGNKALPKQEEEKIEWGWVDKHGGGEHVYLQTTVSEQELRTLRAGMPFRIRATARFMHADKIDPPIFERFGLHEEKAHRIILDNFEIISLPISSGKIE